MNLKENGFVYPLKVIQFDNDEIIKPFELLKKYGIVTESSSSCNERQTLLFVDSNDYRSYFDLRNSRLTVIDRYMCVEFFFSLFSNTKFKSITLNSNNKKLIDNFIIIDLQALKHTQMQTTSIKYCLIQNCGLFMVKSITTHQKDTMKRETFCLFSTLASCTLKTSF